MDSEINERRECYSCKKTKYKCDFYDPIRQRQCKECLSKIRKKKYDQNPYIHIQRVKDYYKNHPEKYAIMNFRKSARRSGVDPNEMELIYKNHNKRCEICGSKDKNNRRLSMDHSHRSGKFRGLLCLRCNNGLGCFSDNVTILKKAINYLKGK